MGAYSLAGCALNWRPFHSKKKMDGAENPAENAPADRPAVSDEAIAEYEPFDLSIRFEELPALTESERTGLVEIKDKKLLERIGSVMPGPLQIASAALAAKTQKVAGSLYHVIIPPGTELSKSREMADAARAIYHGSDGIKGHANLVSAKGEITAMNAVNAAMRVASMVVGQYYMSQINSQLEDIQDGLNKISNFLDNEYKSKVYVLVAEAQKCSEFQMETVESDELRTRELAHLKNLEHECAQLLGQANLTLQGFSENKDIDYEKYESLVSEANNWCQYQQILLEVMYKVGDLTYALNLGAITRENSRALYLPYAKQSEGALGKLNAWHKANASKFEIDIDAARRKCQGLEGIFMSIPALFNADLYYKEIPKPVVVMIRKQSNSKLPVRAADETDLFQEDVRLIAKEGKLYYLPA